MIEPVQSSAELLADLARPLGSGVAASAWRLGQAGVALRVGDRLVLIDLYLSNHCEAVLSRPFDHRRMTRAPLDPAEIATADVVVCTHDHLDHLDPPTMRTLGTASPGAQAIVPLAAAATLRQLDWPQSRIVATSVDTPVRVTGLEVTPVPMRHDDWDVDPDLGFPYQGYVVDDGSVRIAHLGDGHADDRIVAALAAYAPDLLFVPVNGRSAERRRMGFAGNMDAAEAVALAGRIGAGIVVPMHYDMFAQNVDPRAVAAFSDACSAQGVRFSVLEVGQRLDVPA